MVQRPPFDRNNPPPPGGFDPRFSEERAQERRGRDPRFSEERAQERRGPDPRYASRGSDRYDEPDPFERRGRAPGGSGGRGGGSPNRWLLILGGLLLIGAVLFALSLTRSGPGSDALDKGGESKEEEEIATGPEARCAAPATYEAIKRELFRQAAATRGSDEAVFAQLASYATIRVNRPVLREQDQGLERISCQGEVALDLPPGVQVVGGRRTLSASLGYTLQGAADGSGDVVTLSGTQDIVVPLATLSRAGTAAPADGNQEVPEPAGPAPDVPPARPSSPPTSPPAPPAERAPAPQPDSPQPAAETPTASARPSFNCARARTRGEIAVCNSPQLATLDREMAGFYNRAVRESDGERRALLEQTRNRFLAYRDRCRNDSCVADAYRGRISEIRDIVDGRWRPR